MLQELKGIARERNQDCSDFINEILSPHLRKNKKQKLTQELKRGYREMSDLNLALAQEHFKLENKSFFNYEEKLAECD